jgi:hypothetical protein
MKLSRIMAGVAAAAALAAAAAVPAAAAAAGGQPNVDEAAFLAAVSPGQPTQIQARLTVPAVQCTSTGGIEDATVQVAALSGLSPKARTGARAVPGAVNTAGALTVSVSVQGGCIATSALYQAQALGKPLAMTVSPGDKVLLTASFDPSTQQQMATVDDLTTGVTQTKTKTVKGQFQPFSDFAGVQRSGHAPVPDFGAIHWSRARINGAPIGSAETLSRFNLVTSVAHSRLLIRTSPLSPADDSFTSTWVASF